jgi:hypothetical protein
VDTILGADGLPSLQEDSTAADFILRGNFAFSQTNWPTLSGYYYDNVNFNHCFVLQIYDSQSLALPQRVPLLLTVEITTGDLVGTAGSCAVYGFAQTPVSNNLPGYITNQALVYSTSLAGTAAAPTTYTGFGNQQMNNYSFIGYLSDNASFNPAVVYSFPSNFGIVGAQTFVCRMTVTITPCVPFNISATSSLSSTGLLARKYSQFHSYSSNHVNKFNKLIAPKSIIDGRVDKTPDDFNHAETVSLDGSISTLGIDN